MTHTKDIDRGLKRFKREMQKATNVLIAYLLEMDIKQLTIHYARQQTTKNQH